jgi:hypothetical protein
MKNAKTFAKRIQKARKSFSVMGEMLIQIELDVAPIDFLLEVKAELERMNASNYPGLESALLRAKLLVGAQ